jgi:hypothetical protein
MNCAVNVHSITHLVKAGMADTIVSEIKRLEAENATLRAEVERLEKALEEEAACQVGHQENAILIGRLEAQVERLTKAGDAMAEQLDGLSFDSVWDFWNAAKKGKQP